LPKTPKPFTASLEPDPKRVDRFERRERFERANPLTLNG
jgi:hypothetical protein